MTADRRRSTVCGSIFVLGRFVTAGLQRPRWNQKPRSDRDCSRVDNRIAIGNHAPQSPVTVFTMGHARKRVAGTKDSLLEISVGLRRRLTVALKWSERVHLKISNPAAAIKNIVVDVSNHHVNCLPFFLQLQELQANGRAL